MSGVLTGQSVPSVTPPTLGTVVREQRQAAGLSLRELAARCGMTPTRLGEIERGVSTPSAAVLSIVFARISGERPAQASGLAELRQAGASEGMAPNEVDTMKARRDRLCEFVEDVAAVAVFELLVLWLIVFLAVDKVRSSGRR